MWSYPFSDTPLTCSALDQATISVSPKAATNELGTPGQMHTVTATVNAGSGADFSDLLITGTVEVEQANGVGKAIGFLDSNGMLRRTYTALQGPTGLHTDIIEACFVPPDKIVCDQATKAWVDTTPPEIMINSPQDGAKYLLNEVVHADYSVSDAVGVDSTTAPFPDGGIIPTNQAGTFLFTVVATDFGLNTSTESVAYQVRTPVGATQDLESEVVNAALPTDIESGLTDKLVATIEALNKGHDKTAINILKSFINMVNAQRGKTLTDAQADALIAEAQKIIDSINAS